MITVQQLAKEYGVSEKSLRAKLRKAGFNWHPRYARWKAPIVSIEAQQMESIAASLRK